MHSKTEYKFLTNPYVRDVFLSYLVDGARRTVPDGYPIIEEWMVAKEPPDEIVQWDCRHEVGNPSTTGMSFYCLDQGFTPILNNPHRYLDKLSPYSCVIGVDPSPFDNMPLVVQKSQIYNNLAITYFFGSQGLKVVPNVRLGNDQTISMLDAIPRESMIAIGTNGFMKRKRNRELFRNQMDIAIDTLRPTSILIYGPAYEDVFRSANCNNIPCFQYDSHTMKRNAIIKSEKESGGVHNER